MPNNWGAPGRGYGGPVELWFTEQLLNAGHVRRVVDRAGRLEQ